MSLDGLASIQARIADIQQRFVAPPASPVGRDPAGGLASGPATGNDFASLLADATATTNPSPTGTVATSDTSRAQSFLGEALRQAGDPYVWGSSAAPSDADPDAFDCSELTKWAARRVGLDLPDGSWLQYLELKAQGALVPVEEALRTPGALLFSFSQEPTSGGGRPSQAHVAISLGDGRTIEARGKKYGVGTFEAGDRFQYGAVIPGL